MCLRPPPPCCGIFTRVKYIHFAFLSWTHQQTTSRNFMARAARSPLLSYLAALARVETSPQSRKASPQERKPQDQQERLDTSSSVSSGTTGVTASTAHASSGRGAPPRDVDAINSQFVWLSTGPAITCWCMPGGGQGGILESSGLPEKITDPLSCHIGSRSRHEQIKMHFCEKDSKINDLPRTCMRAYLLFQSKSVSIEK